MGLAYPQTWEGAACEKLSFKSKGSSAEDPASEIHQELPFRRWLPEAWGPGFTSPLWDLHAIVNLFYFFLKKSGDRREKATGNRTHVGSHRASSSSLSSAISLPVPKALTRANGSCLCTRHSLQTAIKDTPSMRRTIANSDLEISIRTASLVSSQDLKAGATTEFSSDKSPKSPKLSCQKNAREQMNIKGEQVQENGSH